MPHREQRDIPGGPTPMLLIAGKSSSFGDVAASATPMPIICVQPN
jgi:hypothetical protein